MDTRFWGPGAWQLLHTITFSDSVTATPQQLKDFFDVLPFVLPCKFCRASLTDYYANDPTSRVLAGRQATQKWLYRIHNKVNGKLRTQGLYASDDPTFSAVKEQYMRQDAVATSAAAFPAWDFLFSIAYNHPLKVKGTPMPDAPSPSKLSSPEELNRWNLLDAATRYSYWCKFWKLLPGVLPAVWKRAWSASVPPSEIRDRRAAVSWLWNIRCKFDTDTRDPYREVCSRLIEHSSGCSKSKRARTCRKSRKRN